MKQTMADPDLSQMSKEVSSFAGRVMKDAGKFSSSDASRYTSGFDELAYLQTNKDFLKSEFGCEVMIASADDTGAYDPQNKRNAAFPLKPAIYIE